MSLTIPYRKAIYANGGLNLTTINYQPTPTAARRNASERPQVAMDALILFTDVAHRLALWLSVAMMSVTLIATIYTVFIYLSGSPVEGWTTTMLFLGFGFFGLFALLALMLKYLSILVDLNFKRQKYVFESIEKISK